MKGKKVIEACTQCDTIIRKLFVVIDRDGEDSGHYCSIACIKISLIDWEFFKIVKIKTPKGVRKLII